MRYIDSAYGRSVRSDIMSRVIMIDLSKALFIFLSIFIVSFSAFLFFVDQDGKYDEHYELMSHVAQYCESGDWVDIPTYSFRDEKFTENANFQGKIITADMRMKKMTDERSELLFVTNPNFSLVFFGGRDVEIAGRYKEGSQKKVLYVDRIKCIGAEAQENIKDERQEMMQFITKNKNNIIEDPDEFIVEDITFVDESVVYVYMVQKNGENRMQKLYLVQMEKNNDSYTMFTLATYKLDNQKFVLVDGVDDYKNARQTVYEYNKKADRWTLAR